MITQNPATVNIDSFMWEFMGTIANPDTLVGQDLSTPSFTMSGFGFHLEGSDGDNSDSAPVDTGFPFMMDATITSFTLAAESVPEPSGVMFLGVYSIGFCCRRCRRGKVGSLSATD